MTIKGLCDKVPRCTYCTFHPICPYIGDIDGPLSNILDKDNEKITNAIIMTAKILTEVDHD